jgi:putative sugar O-methyltransferase
MRERDESSENLIKAYKENLKNSQKYLHTRSLHWEKYYKENQKFLEINNLKNFRNNQILSKGLDDATYLQNKFNLIEKLKLFNFEFLRRTLPEKNIGNCNFSQEFLGYYFDYGIIHHLKWFEKIEKYIKEKSMVLEIGGGFGSLARIIIKNKNTKYFLIDLPEANLLSNYYLKNFFPEKKIFNYLDFKNLDIEKEINNFDIFIIPPNTLKSKKLFFDFIINTRSFMEMKMNIIQEYFDLIQNKIVEGGFFLNVNRYLKSTVGEDIYFYKYPYDEKWDVVISEKSFLQDHICFFLAIRKKVVGNIKEELKKIEIITQNQKFFIIKSNLINSLTSPIKKIFYLIIKKVLIILFGKKKIKRIAQILYNISFK